MKLTSKRTPLWLACILLVTIAAGTAAGTPKQSSGFRIGILPQLTLFQAGFQTERRSNLMMYIAPRIIQDDESRAPHEPMFADNDASPVETLERWASSTANSAVAGKLATATREPAFWGELYAGRQKYQTRSSRSGLESCTTGVMMGVHYPIGADLLVGLMLGYERNNFDISHSGGHGDMDSLRFGPYASKRFGPWVVDASVTVGFIPPRS